jgi:hypothetical protein
MLTPLFVPEITPCAWLLTLPPFWSWIASAPEILPAFVTAPVVPEMLIPA